ncbi:MAG TPA: DUF547 domain-containing protein [Gemmatimonadota bacterium]|jgi:hypothetical protein
MRAPCPHPLLLVAVALAGYQAPAFPQPAADGAQELYASVLSRYVAGGDVRYGLLLTENPPEWRRYLKWLDDARPESMTIDERRAFWINAYNARVIAGVLERYPVDSVRDVGFFGGRFRGFFGRREHPVAGEVRTLDEIEKEILFEAPLADPRIHFALNCAARSCPKLRAEPYEASRLDTQLDFQTRTFLNGPDGTRLDPTARVLYVSRVLDWYRGDFEAAAGSVREYLIRHLTGEKAAAARDPGWTIEYLDYDWSLNDVM